MENHCRELNSTHGGGTRTGYICHLTPTPNPLSHPRFSFSLLHPNKYSITHLTSSDSTNIDFVCPQHIYGSVIDPFASCFSNGILTLFYTGGGIWPLYIIYNNSGNTGSLKLKFGHFSRNLVGTCFGYIIGVTCQNSNKPEIFVINIF